MNGLENLSFEELLRVRDLLELAEEIRRAHHCSLDELRKGREQHEVAARRAFAHRLAGELRWSASAIARLLDCAPSTVTNLLRPKGRAAA